MNSAIRASRLRPRLRLWLQQSLQRAGTITVCYDVAAILCLAWLTGSLLHPALLNTDTLPTGGDTASQLLYAKVFQDELLPSLRLTGWMPEVFAGYPLMSYYFPMPFLAAAALGQCLGLGAGLKWAMVLPSLLLPGTIFALSRHALQLPWLAAWAAALGSLAFLLHEQNAIWGGNLLSVLAGEFAYSWGMWMSLLGFAAWWRAARQPGRPGNWLVPAVLEALTGLCHGYPLLWLGSASFLLLLAGGAQRPIVMLLLKGHLAAFALLGGWLWPLLEMHPYTIPNDAVTRIASLADALPPALWPVLGAGALGLAGLWARHGMTAKPGTAQREGDADGRNAATGLLWFTTLAAAWAVCLSIGAERVGLLDVRFLPLSWIAGALVCGWASGLWLQGIGTARSKLMLCLALTCALMAWLTPRIRDVPVWAHWNHSGLEVKPQWQVLSQLIPFMQGALTSPRLLFEHDPDNADLGSTRVLEALPMFLGGRPVLEGLYMESALLGPAIFQLQSEVSARPSSPLVRFPSGRLNPRMAATHMRMLNADQVLLRSPEAVRALAQSGLFEAIASAGPFTLMRLKDFRDALVDPTPRPWILRSHGGWMADSYKWFRSASHMQEGWPVYSDAAPDHVRRALASSARNVGGSSLTAASVGSVDPHVTSLRFSRHQVVFKTNHPGQPHLIKIAYHPRWELKTPGHLLLAAPGFMLVIPEGKEVELAYGTTWVGRTGEMATLITLGLLVWKLAMTARRVRHGVSKSKETVQTPTPERLTLLNWWTGSAVMAVIAAYLAMSSPGIAYFDGWEAYRQGRYHEAAALFVKAHEGRRSPAGREEALFWSAKAADAAGDTALALNRFSQLVQTYHGHWVEESLGEVARLASETGAHDLADTARRRLLTEYPTD